MTLATMDEEELSKVTITDSIPANNKRGTCILVLESARRNNQLCKQTLNHWLANLQEFLYKWSTVINFYVNPYLHDC